MAKQGKTIAYPIENKVTPNSIAAVEKELHTGENPINTAVVNE